MRKKISTILFIACAVSLTAKAQNEAQVGIFTGIYNSTLLNGNDQTWGGYLPTYKTMVGVEGGYYATVGGKVPIGFSFQAGYWGNGQNYRSLYSDSSYYEAYAHLNYMRVGGAFHLSTNLRRRVVAEVFGGANMGFLDGYRERFEHFRNGADRFVIEINDNSVYYNDTEPLYGSMDERLYLPIEMNYFYGAGVNVKVTKKLVFKLSGRFDMGMGNIENGNTKKITFGGENATVLDYPTFVSAVKYHTTLPEITRGETVNMMYGVFLGLSWRFYDPTRHDLNYW